MSITGKLHIKIPEDADIKYMLLVKPPAVSEYQSCLQTLTLSHQYFFWKIKVCYLPFLQSWNEARMQDLTRESLAAVIT